MAKGEIVWQGGEVFHGRASHGQLTIAPTGADGAGDRVGPKELIVLGLAGCTGIDVVDILEKMRVAPTRFSIAVRSEDAETHPKYMRRLFIHYEIEGEATEDQARRAVTLSMEKYCGVSATLSGRAELVPELVLNGKPVDGIGTYGPDVAAPAPAQA